MQASIVTARQPSIHPAAVRQAKDAAQAAQPRLASHKVGAQGFPTTCVLGAQKSYLTARVRGGRV